MPIGDRFDDWDECIEAMTEEEGHDEASAESICGALEAEAKADHGDPDALLDALQRGAGLIADVGVDLVSGVDVPAVDSKWVMTKSGGARKGHDYRAQSPILLAKDADTDQRISYAAAMIPREPDKEGDVVATPTVEQAAHDFLKSDGGVDTDHSLIDGEGEVVESWVLKDDRTFDLPGGATETYGAGTWMVGIEWGADAWERIKSGDLSGLSIYGMAEHVPLDKSAEGCPHCGGERTEDTSQSADTHKGADAESAGMASDQANGGDDAADGGDDSGGDGGPDIGEVAASLDDLAETVESVKEAVETGKQDEQEAAAELGDAYDVRPGDVLDIVEAAANHDAADVLTAIDSLSEAEASADEEAKEDDDEDEEEKDVEKRADEANLDKGGDATATAQKAVTDDGEATSGTPSFKALAEQAEAED